MLPPLPAPTLEFVKAECDEFDREPSTQLGEEALDQLRVQFPGNKEISHVLLKVLVLNKLYSARVHDNDVETLARHIAALGIDPLLAEGSSRAVHLITDCPNLRLHYYSFATKFCSWHNATAYPIFDGNMNECLWSYKRQDPEKKFAQFRREDLKDYEKLIATVNDFRSDYKLDSLTFREIDKFLWRLGAEILKERREKDKY